MFKISKKNSKKVNLLFSLFKNKIQKSEANIAFQKYYFSFRTLFINNVFLQFNFLCSTNGEKKEKVI